MGSMGDQGWNQEEVGQYLSMGGRRFLKWLEGCPLSFQCEVCFHMTRVVRALHAEAELSVDAVPLWCEGYRSACYVRSVASGHGFDEAALIYGLGVDILVGRLQTPCRVVCKG